jgi:hypothetical protein
MMVSPVVGVYHRHSKVFKLDVGCLCWNEFEGGITGPVILYVIHEKVIYCFLTYDSRIA